uniref:C-type lectin domain-containing protein n=1 Tax=Panagrolaimus superbus TaxID=310955 RepID=A0A914YU77_9BILA
MKFDCWLFVIFFYSFSLSSIIISAEECSPKIDGFCYLFFNFTKGFSEAELSCRQYANGHLTSIHDILINDIVGDYANRYDMNKFWIGGNLLTNSEIWSWTDNSAFDFNVWAQGEPDLLPGYQCIFMEISTKLWYTYDCFKDLSYVCKIPSTSYFLTTTSSGGGFSSVGTVSPGVTVSAGMTTVASTTQNGNTHATTSHGSLSSHSTFFSILPQTTTTQGHVASSSNPTTPKPSLPPTTSTTTPTKRPSTTTTEASSGTVCEFGWQYFGPTHSCYKNTTNKYNLQGAENACISAGAKLTSVENAAEYGFLNRKFKKQCNIFGIGLDFAQMIIVKLGDGSMENL